MELTRRLRGKQVACVMTNGHVLAIRTEDGAEIRVVWVDDNGDVLKGRPLVQGHGLRMRAEGLREIIDGREAGLGKIVVPQRGVG
jgi:hypothetical protein